MDKHSRSRCLILTVVWFLGIYMYVTCVRVCAWLSLCIFAGVRVSAHVCVRDVCYIRTTSNVGRTYSAWRDFYFYFFSHISLYVTRTNVSTLFFVYTQSYLCNVYDKCHYAWKKTACTYLANCFIAKCTAIFFLTRSLCAIVITCIGLQVKTRSSRPTIHAWCWLETEVCCGAVIVFM
jgi:hypothetical protein